jgi:hypothetical protein
MSVLAILSLSKVIKINHPIWAEMVPKKNNLRNNLGYLLGFLGYYQTLLKSNLGRK